MKYINVSQLMFIRTALKKKTHGSIVSNDERGHRTHPNKLSDHIRESVKIILDYFHQWKIIIVESNMCPLG